MQMQWIISSQGFLHVFELCSSAHDSAHFHLENTFLIALNHLMCVGCNWGKNPTRTNSICVSVEHDVLGFSSCLWRAAKVSSSRSPVANSRGGSGAVPPGELGVTCERTWPCKPTPKFACQCEGPSISAIQGPGRKNLLAFVRLPVPLFPARPHPAWQAGPRIILWSPHSAYSLSYVLCVCVCACVCICVCASFTALQPQRLDCLDRKALSQLPTITSRP